jgi:thioredoxin reductase
MANGFAAGGQLTTTTDVENFPGFPSGILGPELMDKFREQSIRFGTNVITETVSKIDLSIRPFQYWREGQEDEEPETTDAVIIATGASAKRLGLEGEATYWQSGISACAVCDGAVPIFRNKPLAVIGGGDSAAEEATCELLLFSCFNLNILLRSKNIARPHEIRFTHLCPCSPSRTTRIKNHAEAAPQQPQNSEYFR